VAKDARRYCVCDHPSGAIVNRTSDQPALAPRNAAVAVCCMRCSAMTSSCLSTEQRYALKLIARSPHGLNGELLVDGPAHTDKARGAQACREEI
jgi:hypothetical protein